ncbi:MAG: hypothetical protein AB7O97_16160 [Planctomycetota bacterium]
MSGVRAWLALAVLSLPAPTQSPAQSPALEPCRALLRELDRSFNAGDAEGYLARFEPEHPMVQAVHARTVRARLGGAVPVQRTGEVTATRRIGQYVVAPVVYEYRSAEQDPLIEAGLLVARPLDADDPDSGLAPVLAVDVPTDRCGVDDVFTCPACNYRIGGAEGWLCVPIAQDRTAVVEGATFLLLGTDLALDVSVQLGDSALGAASVVAGLLQQLRRRAPTARTTPPADWLPPSVPAGVEGLGGARAEAELEDGDKLVVHALTLGRLRHLLLLRGAEDALARRAAAVDALLATYRLLVTDANVAQQAAKALQAHTGGDVAADGVYRNERHGIAAQGPRGWVPQRRCAGSPFQVVWSCPRSSGRMWLTGYAPPAGFPHWTTELADRWLADLLRRAGMQAHADVGAWTEPATGPRELRVIAVDATAVGPGQASRPERHLHLVLRDDLLVVADAYTTDPDEVAAVQKAVGSLRSAR